MVSTAVTITAPSGMLLPPRNLFARVPEMHAEKGEIDFPIYSKKAGAEPCYENVAHFLDYFGIVIVWNEFALDYQVSGLPGFTVLDDNAVNDIHTTMHRLDFNITEERLRGFLRNIGYAQRVHPLRARFDRLEQEWDGQPRLDTWLRDYCHIADNDFTRFVASSTLMMQVRRVRQPGYDYKYVPVLEGKQGIGKSPILRVLAFDRYYNENLEIGDKGKDVISKSRNVMIHELGELANLSRRDAETFKAFTSRVVDRDRLPYDKSDTAVPRQFLLWGNSNRQDYNRDVTGNDRILSVLCNDDIDSDRMLLIDELRAELPQIYGEAAHRERTATNAELHPRGDVLILHRVEQDKRFHKDGYFLAIEAALEDVDTTKGAFVPTRELIKACMPGADVFNPCDGRLTKPIADAMKKLGWTDQRRWVSARVYGDSQKSDTIKTAKVSGYVKEPLAVGVLDTVLTYDSATATLVPTLNPHLDG